MQDKLLCFIFLAQWYKQLYDLIHIFCTITGLGIQQRLRQFIINEVSQIESKLKEVLVISQRKQYNN